MANSTQGNDWSLYPYSPTKVAPIVFAILLTVIGCVQIYQSFFKYHWKKFGGKKPPDADRARMMTQYTEYNEATMTWATSVWVAGFICRSISVYHVQNVNIYIAQFVLIIVGPPLYAAAEYFILGRLLAYLPYHAPIHPGRVVSTFLFLSVVVESLTANGAAESAGDGRTPAQVKIGLDLLKAALILQCFVEAFFFALVAMTEYRCRRAGEFPQHIRPIFYLLYVTSFMMLVRCVVRTVEGFEASKCSSALPSCGTIDRNEWFLWVFEIANITLFVILLAVFHPGRYLPRSSKVFLDMADMKTERVGPGFSKADKRARWRSFVDPFNFHGIITGEGMTVERFWEVEQPAYDGGDLRRPEKVGRSLGFA